MAVGAKWRREGSRRDAPKVCPAQVGRTLEVIEHSKIAIERGSSRFRP